MGRGSTPPTGVDQAMVSEVLLNVAETMSQITDAAKAQRDSYEAAGFSPTMSEQMAANFHQTLVLMVLKGGKS